MPGQSSSVVEWWSVLEPAAEAVFYRRGDADDPRLGEVVRRWPGGRVNVSPGQPVLIGFPCDEGVRRNGGRAGAAAGPDAIRSQLYRLTPWDGPTLVDLATLGLLDLGNVGQGNTLESSQERLGVVIATVLGAGAVPIVLGGGHETAFGHYLGYVGAALPCALINVDAHLDVRAYPNGGHSGSPFRQAIEHARQPLRSGRYVVIACQRQSVAQAHWEFVQRHDGRAHWFQHDDSSLETLGVFTEELNRLVADSGAVMVTVDADAFRDSDVPGVSAPSAVGLRGDVWPALAFLAGRDHAVRSIELVEVNPAFDRDAQTARWAALGVRQFLAGLAGRRSQHR